YIDRPVVKLGAAVSLGFVRREQLASVHQIEVRLNIRQFAPCASVQNRLAWTAALLRIYGADPAHEGCKVSWRPVGIQIHPPAPAPPLFSLRLGRSRLDWFVEDRIEMDSAATVVQLRDDAERQELGAYRPDNLLLARIHAPRVQIDVQPCYLRDI